jgi:hypothetical protein
LSTTQNLSLFPLTPFFQSVPLLTPKLTNKVLTSRVFLFFKVNLREICFMWLLHSPCLLYTGFPHVNVSLWFCSPAFQRFAVRTSKNIEDISKKGTTSSILISFYWPCEHISLTFVLFWQLIRSDKSLLSRSRTSQTKWR